ncbi:SHS2 domain-containing protein [Halobiforma haloterrestris]|uniref:SHS2 domain-containing protein n=1 Tax=Natronobacterium haloterrestre TaxID=148448 RepID=A0A1I1JW85_NATHA|nr:archease [Halobiforma haloterrestris]SFC50043.1 SHS2 domain-containing protein [Halobiforma haloterrestris]
MAFELRDHTADVAVAATGGTLEEVFAAVADGLAAASTDEVPEGTGERFQVSVTAESREALLFDYLDELIYRRDVRAALPVDNRVESIERGGDEDEDGNREARKEDGHRHGDGEHDSWTLEATTRGVPLSEIDAREVKAVTYSEMRLERTDDGWEAYVVFDV